MNTGDSALRRPVASRRHIWVGRWRRLPWIVRKLPIVVLVGAVLSAIPFAWTELGASGHLSTEADVEPTGVVIVLGSEVVAGTDQPMPILRGRLDAAAALVRARKARVILVTGDAGGHSGNETSAMTSYLRRLGISPQRIVIDPYGLDTYDSCLRAKQVYGINQALIITQSYHLSRAVTLCRHVGIATTGVPARCSGCKFLDLAHDRFRDYFASTKALSDALRDRPPAIESPPSTAIATALAAS